MRKLYLHVGVHRTGTTSTQRVLRDNFQGLVQRGYLYPFGVERHDDLVRKMRQGKIAAADLAEDLTRRADSQMHPVHSIILSDEDMSMVRDFSLFAPLADRFEVKVVCMLRRQDLWLESWYLQNVKWQWDRALANLTFDDFMARRAGFFWIDYAARFAHFEGLFGPGSVLPAVFERRDMPLGPTAAVLQAFGITDPQAFGTEVHQNSSLSPLMSEFIRHLPLHQLREPERSYYELAAMAVDAGLAQGASRLILPSADRAAILAEHAPGNALVARRWFGREELFRDALPAPDAPLAEREMPADSATLMQTFVIPMMMALGKQVSDQRERMEQIQSSLEEVRRHSEEALRIRRVPRRA